ADGIPMVFHDEELDRLTAETGPVNAHTAAELGRIVLKGSTDTIPTLAEVLGLIAGKVPLLIEIKDQTLVMGPTDGRLEAATAEVLKVYKGDVALMSFNPHSIARMAKLAPLLPRGITTSAYDPDDWAPLPVEVCDRLRPIPDYDDTGSSFISHEGRDLARPRVAELKAQGAKVLCWTIRSAADEALARRVADNVTFEGYLAALPA
ncbi:MAG TPA: glycerophosphodiester phosphodiesterase family protein, partial [Tabrizicola sp.]|nr:glycerophosphodiester phosphodiesterase family protein [Tabrizicola sp.]